MIGVLPPRFRGGPWQILSGRMGDLVEEGAVSTDIFDRKILNNAGPGTAFELNGRRVHVAVQTRGVRGFGATYIFTTLDRARALGDFPANKVSAFLVETADRADIKTIRNHINTTMYGVRAWTKKELSRSTVSTILGTSGIAFSVGTLIIFATLSGIIIIGLTMYSAAVDRLRDYGTLKAIGADNRTIRNLILTQALIFRPGWIRHSHCTHRGVPVGNFQLRHPIRIHQCCQNRFLRRNPGYLSGRGSLRHAPHLPVRTRQRL